MTALLKFGCFVLICLVAVILILLFVDSEPVKDDAWLEEWE